HFGAARRRHLFAAAGSQRQGEIAFLQGTRRRARAQGKAELPAEAAKGNGHSDGSAGLATVSGSHPGKGGAGGRTRPRSFGRGACISEGGFLIYGVLFRAAHANRNRSSPPGQIRLQLRLQGRHVGGEIQAPVEARRVLSAVPVHFRGL